MLTNVSGCCWNTRGERRMDVTWFVTERGATILTFVDRHLPVQETSKKLEPKWSGQPSCIGRVAHTQFNQSIKGFCWGVAINVRWMTTQTIISNRTIEKPLSVTYQSNWHLVNVPSIQYLRKLWFLNYRPPFRLCFVTFQACFQVRSARAHRLQNYNWELVVTCQLAGNWITLHSYKPSLSQLTRLVHVHNFTCPLPMKCYVVNHPSVNV